jgi:hypothetical protein
MINKVSMIFSIVAIGLSLLSLSTLRSRAETFTLDTRVVSVPVCRDSFKGLPRLAKRLGVKPGSTGGEMVLHTCKNGDYSLVRLIDALLDRMDRSAKP